MIFTKTKTELPSKFITRVINRLKKLKKKTTYIHLSTNRKIKEEF